MGLTLRQLECLVALADAGHFGRAAEAVHISQPALSMQVRGLEAALGTVLVERGARGAVFTPTGREILHRARRILAEARDIEQVARWARGISGRLRVGVIPTVAPYLLPAALPLLRARDLALDLGVREAQTEVLLDELRDGLLDAVVVALPVVDPGLVGLPLFEDCFLLAGSRRALDALGERIEPADMRPGQLLLLDDGHCLTDQTIAACGVDRVETRTDLRAASLTTLCRLASEGFGLTFLPEIAAPTECAAAPRLATRRFATPEPGRIIGLVRRHLSGDGGWFRELGDVLIAAHTAEKGAGNLLDPAE